MPQFTVLIVTRRKDGTPATYTLTHEIESRVAMFNYALDKYTTSFEDVESIRILEEVND
jgi:hypothetical protein